MVVLKVDLMVDSTVKLLVDRLAVLKAVLKDTAMVEKWAAPKVQLMVAYSDEQLADSTAAASDNVMVVKWAERLDLLSADSWDFGMVAMKVDLMGRMMAVWKVVSKVAMSAEETVDVLVAVLADALVDVMVDALVETLAVEMVDLLE